MTIIKRIGRGFAVLALFAGAMALVLGGDRIWAGGHTGGAGNDLRADLLSRPLTPKLGGEGSVDTIGPRAFRSIMPNADNSLVQTFLFGQRIFDIVWSHERMNSPVLDGLGPMFNRTGCRECHEGNGRGFPPPPDATVAKPMKSMLIRLSIPGEGDHGGPNPVPNYGDQLQDRAVEGVPAEGQALIIYEEIPGEFADGTPYSLRKPTVQIMNTAYGDLPADTLMSPRVATPVIGLGLLAAVPVETLQALADPDDTDGDGISGRMNVAWDAATPPGKVSIGRFGWKANVPSTMHQTAGAALGDMGLTSSVFTENLCEPAQEDCIKTVARSAATADAPEIHPQLLAAMNMYMNLLAVPIQRNADDPAVQRGEASFRGIGCSSCHMPTLLTGKHLPHLSNQVIHPFTDLLIHDMGEGLADNRPDYLASGREWRTQPLWGIGLTHDVALRVKYLHDGRARNLTEAILWHGGEAESRREAFRSLGKEQRGDLLAFLGSL
jgi:CxxC motif-containing protein (DUF1111 family)